MGKVREGDHVGAFGALEWNRHVDASDDYHRRKARGEARLLPSEPAISTGRVKAKNSTEGNLAEGSVVQLSTPLLTTLAYGETWFDGITPTLDFGKHHAVFPRAVPSGDIDDALVAGVVMARVDVADVKHPFCIPTSGQTYFTSSPLGPYRLLQVPGGTGELLLPVCLGGGIITAIGTAAEEIETDDAGDVNLQHGTPGSETDTTIDALACWNDGPPIASGDEVSVTLVNWRLYVALRECPPEE